MKNLLLPQSLKIAIINQTFNVDKILTADLIIDTYIENGYDINNLKSEYNDFIIILHKSIRNFTEEFIKEFKELKTLN